MSASDVARSQRVLDKVGARLGLSPAGKEWVIAAIDPYHDTPINCCGYPDNNEAASVVQVVKLSAALVVPAAAGSGNWDCHIHQFPWMEGGFGAAGNFSQTTNGNQITGTGVFLLGNSITTPTGVSPSSTLWGGMVVDSVASGANTFQYNDLGTSIAPFQTQLKPYLTGEYRVVAMGFEVINTTAELNVQGLATVYRQPVANLDSAKSTLVTSGPILSSGGTISTTNFGYPDLLLTNTPPATPGEALLLDGSKQWKAKDGCYVVSTFNSSENPPGANATTPVLHLSALDSVSAQIGWLYVTPSNNGGQVYPAPFQPSPINGNPAATPNVFNMVPLPTGGVWFQPFNGSGVIFSGLSNSSTLQLNAIYYIERFPTQQDSDLVVLARESCRGDSIALDLYSEIVKEMPVGVPQRMNGMGEWFADAVSSAADFISPVLSAIPLPMAQTVGAGIKMAGNVAKSLGSKKEAPGQTYSSTGSNVSAKGAKPKVAMPAKKKKG
jgi:hypothetical protein